MSYYALTDSDWPWDDQDEGRAIVIEADTPQEAVKIATEMHLTECQGAGGVDWKVARLMGVGFEGVDWEDDKKPVFDGFNYYPPGSNGPLDLPPVEAAAFAHHLTSALVQPAPADAAVVEAWQPIETAPKDGTAIDLWGVNHLHPAKTGRRATDVTWGRIRDWMGNERDGWQHGQNEDFEPTHWMHRPLPPALSSIPTSHTGEDGSSITTIGGGNG